MEQAQLVVADFVGGSVLAAASADGVDGVGFGAIGVGEDRGIRCKPAGHIPANAVIVAERIA